MDKRILIFKDITKCTIEEKMSIRILRNSKDIRQFMYTDHIITKDEHINYINNLKADKKNLIFIVIDNFNKVIGLISLNSINKIKENADWAFYVSPKIKNIGSVIEYYFIEFFFKNFKFEKLNCEVLENNISTQSLHKRFLFKEEGFKNKKIIKGGKELKIILFGLTKNIWFKRKVELSIFKKYFDKYNVIFDYDKKSFN